MAIEKSLFLRFFRDRAVIVGKKKRRPYEPKTRPLDWFRKSKFIRHKLRRVRKMIQTRIRSRKATINDQDYSGQTFPWNRIVLGRRVVLHRNAQVPVGLYSALHRLYKRKSLMATKILSAAPDQDPTEDKYMILRYGLISHYEE